MSGPMDCFTTLAMTVLGIPKGPATQERRRERLPDGEAGDGAPAPALPTPFPQNLRDF